MEETLDAKDDAGVDELANGGVLDATLEEAGLLPPLEDPPPQATRPNNMQERSVSLIMALPFLSLGAIKA